MQVRSLSPEARRLRAQNNPVRFAAREGLITHQVSPQAGLLARIAHYTGPGTRVFETLRRTLLGTWQDGFIHAGNLAYLSMLAIFPFFIIGAALFDLIGGRELALELVNAVLVATPPTVSRAIAPVALEIVDVPQGWVLWLGVGVALWTASNLIETIRDILRRAYGTKPLLAFWKARLFSAALIIGAVVLLMVSLFASVMIGTIQQVILSGLPQLSEMVADLRISRIVPAIGLTVALYLLFYSLTPPRYRRARFPKWPGPLFTAAWWIGVTTIMPPVMRSAITYDLIYGSMAGIIIALFFFWLVGLGLVIGAELNAALAEPENDPQGFAQSEEE
ncbi:YihY/virulence factor BrkB family protein [Erythrobacter sp. SCSIO 43205]|nr:YihY/virulence factor BrkB family protein [Erythrobacter sp. SCSIO 43205]